jgi:hypothetical protein
MAKDDTQDQDDLMTNMDDRDAEQLQKELDDADRDENLDTQQGE